LKFFRNLSVKGKLVGGFSLVILFLLAVVIVSFTSLSNVGEGADVILEHAHEMEEIGDLQVTSGEYLMPANDVIITKDVGEIEAFKELDKELDDSIGAIEKRLKVEGEETAEELALVEEIKKNKASVKEKAEGIFAVYEDTKLAGEKMEEMDAEGGKLIESIEKLHEITKGHMEKAMEIVDSTEGTAKTTDIIIGLIAVAFAVGIVLVLDRGISKPLNKLAGNMKSIASEGISEDRMMKVEELGKNRVDEIGNVVNSFGLITGNLAKQAEKMGKEAQRAKARIYDAIFTRDAERNITYFNEAAAKLTGYSVEEAMKMKCRDVFKADACGNCVIDECMRTKEPFEGAQVAIRNKDGKEILVLCRADAFLDDKGEAIGGMEIIRDVTQERNMLDKAAEASKKMTESAQGLSASSGQMSQATEQVASAIGQVAQGAGEQSKSASEAAEVVNQISSAIEQVAQGAQDQAKTVTDTTNNINELSEIIGEVAKTIQGTTDLAQKGNKATDETIEGMDRIKDVVLGTATKIGVLGKQSKQIGEIVNVINDIAEQTNLLALNAAIEAARAGEHGKGFAVVADEVRKLAERSGSATKEIAGLIKGIQVGVEEAVESMEKGTSEVEKGVGLAGNTGSAIKEMMNTIGDIAFSTEKMAASTEQVVKAVDSIASITEENTAATEEVAASTEKMVKSVDSIASVSQETAASAEEVSASSEEQSASVNEIMDSAQELAKIAGELDEMVKKFTL